MADVLPTFSAIAGAVPPDNLDGVNVWPVILGKEKAPKNRFMYWEHDQQGLRQAVRWNNWKGVKLRPEKDWKLYNLTEDPGETSNIAKDHPQIVKRINQWAKENRTESKFYPTK